MCNCSTPQLVWYKMNCNDLSLTSNDHTVTITKGPNACEYNFSVSSSEPITYSFLNGLTNTSGTVKLGGTLVEFTDINNSGNDFFLHGTGSNILRTVNGTLQSSVVSSSISSQMAAVDSSSNLFSEVNSIAGRSTLTGGNNTTFYNTIYADASFLRMEVKTNTTPIKFEMNLLGKLQASAYGVGAFTGTATHTLQVDGSGNIIEGSVVSTGTTAPSSTPSKVGDMYVDTSAKKLYFAAGTSSSSDWIIAN